MGDQLRDASSSPVVVRCKNLRKTYEGKVEAVRGLDLTIYTGQCYGLLGPNGAGKTTTSKSSKPSRSDFRNG